MFTRSHFSLVADIRWSNSHEVIPLSYYDETLPKSMERTQAEIIEENDRTTSFGEKGLFICRHIYLGKQLLPQINNCCYCQNGSCVLISKLCAEVWRTGYEFSLNPGNENSTLEMETPKFPTKIDFTGKVQAFKLKLQTSDQILCFQSWMAHSQLGGSFKPGRPLPLEI